jgi:phosphate-selective porin OprO/OprP
MSVHKNILTAVLITSGILTLPNIAFANDSSELEQLRALVQQLDQQVKVLARQQEIATEEAETKKKETPVIKAGENGFGFQSADGNFTLNIGGRLQADGRFYPGGASTSLSNLSTANTYQYQSTASPDTFLVKQFRPYISGTVYGIFDYQFVSDFGNGATVIQDAWINGRISPAFQVQVGKQKSPFGLERLQGDSDRKFAELGLTTNLVPNRDIGIKVHGQLLDNRLDYAVGYFDGVPDGSSTDKYANSDTDNNRDKDFVARVFAKPFKNEPGFLQGLGFGVAATYGDLRGNGSTTSNSSSDTALGVSDTNLSSYKTDLGQQTFFSYYNLANANNANGTSSPDKYATYANGERFRWAPQFYYYNGPFGLIGEYIGEIQAVSKYADGYVAGNSPAGSANKSNLYSAKLNNNAWQIAASWLLTGEDAGFTNPKVKNKFNPEGGGWGAWELVARYSELNIDNAAFAALNPAYVTSGVARSGNSYADPRVSASSAKAWATGLNWYPNNIVKLTLDYEHTSFDGGYTIDNIHVINRPSEDVVLGRVQLAF